MSDDNFHSTPYGPIRDSYLEGNINPVADSAFLPIGSQAWHGARDREASAAATEALYSKPTASTSLTQSYSGSYSSGGRFDNFIHDFIPGPLTAIQWLAIYVGVIYFVGVNLWHVHPVAAIIGVIFATRVTTKALVAINSNKALLKILSVCSVVLWGAIGFKIAYSIWPEDIVWQATFVGVGSYVSYRENKNWLPKKFVSVLSLLGTVEALKVDWSWKKKLAVAGIGGVILVIIFALLIHLGIWGQQPADIQNIAQYPRL